MLIPLAGAPAGWAIRGIGLTSGALRPLPGAKHPTGQCAGPSLEPGVGSSFA